MRRTIVRFNPASSFGCLVSISLALILLGAPLLIFAFMQRHSEKSAPNWKSTEGTLLVDEVVRRQGKSHRRVLYTYTGADGTLQTNTAIGIGFDGNNNTDFPRTMDLPQKVIVWYNPENPKASALVLRSRGTGFLFPLGVMFTLFGLILLFSAIDNRRRKRVWVEGIGWVKVTDRNLSSR